MLALAAAMTDARTDEKTDEKAQPGRHFHGAARRRRSFLACGAVN